MNKPRGFAGFHNADLEKWLICWLDRCALAGMVAGVGLMLQPLWGEGLRYGFFATALCTILHIITSHWQIEER